MPEPGPDRWGGRRWGPPDGRRPRWWPEGEAWPPADGAPWRHARRRFMWRFGCAFLFFILLVGSLIALVAWARRSAARERRAGADRRGRAPSHRPRRGGARLPPRERAGRGSHRGGGPRRGRRDRHAGAGARPVGGPLAGSSVQRDELAPGRERRGTTHPPGRCQPRAAHAAHRHAGNARRGARRRLSRRRGAPAARPRRDATSCRA